MPSLFSSPLRPLLTHKVPTQIYRLILQMAGESDFPKHAGNYRFNNRLSFVELFYWDELKIDDSTESESKHQRQAGRS